MVEPLADDEPDVVGGRFFLGSLQLREKWPTLSQFQHLVRVLTSSSGDCGIPNLPY